MLGSYGMGERMGQLAFDAVALMAPMSKMKGVGTALGGGKTATAAVAASAGQTVVNKTIEVCTNDHVPFYD
jgi:hypothetical protein